MHAVVWEAPGKLALAEVPDPTPGHGELIVQVGACGTDVHIADGEFPPTPPLGPRPRSRPRSAAWIAVGAC
jgi:D-arabinose 1-dehydrogenase-like Zn-dependent alcohol dehydrogenase